MLGCFAVAGWSSGLSAVIPLPEVFSIEAAVVVAGREVEVVPVAVFFSLEAET
jgi:hypothetical protein